MHKRFVTVSLEEVELLGEAPALGVEEFARCACVTTQWVHEHVEAGVLGAQRGQGGAWRLSGTSVARARRLLHLERAYDADPQLAALTVDLVEEVVRLRRQLGER